LVSPRVQAPPSGERTRLDARMGIRGDESISLSKG
jgi:hypothetical protein